MLKGNLTLLLEKAMVYRARGDAEDALLILQDVLASSKPFPAARIFHAQTLVQLGDRDGAITALQAALETGFHDHNMVTEDGVLRTLESEHRFQRLLRDMADSQQNARQDPVPTVFEATEPVDVKRTILLLQRAKKYSKGWNFSFDGANVDSRKGRIRSADYAGKNVLYIAWGTWSQLARKIMPVVQDVGKTFQVEIVLLAWENIPGYDTVGAEVRRQLATMGVADLACAVVTPEHFKKIYLPSIPTFYFVNERGVCEGYAHGTIDAGGLKSLVRAFLAPAPEGELPKLPLPRVSGAPPVLRTTSGDPANHKRPGHGGSPRPK